MADSVRCINGKCPMKNHCWRFTGPICKGDSYTTFKPEVVKMDDGTKGLVCDAYAYDGGYGHGSEDEKG